MDPTRIVIYCDGLCEPRNPGGYACWAWVALDSEGNEIARKMGCVARGEGATNNLAEYAAVGKALRWVAEQQVREPLVRTDSMLVVQQVNGVWACRAAHLQPLMRRVQELVSQTNATLEWVPREQNQRADALSRLAYQRAKTA